MRIAVLSAFLSLGLMACPSWFESDGGGDDFLGQPAAPQVEANAPAADVSLELGEPLEIRYSDDGVGGDTDVVAVRESDGMEIQIALNRPHVDGVEQTVVWNTAGAASGTWRIEFRSTRDGESSTTAAPGEVTLTSPPPPPPGGSPDFDAPTSTDSVSDGGYIVGGVYTGQLQLTGGPTLPSTGSEAAGFVVRYRPDGTLRWARAFHATGGPAQVFVSDVVVLEGDMVAVVGYYEALDGRLVVAPGEFDELVLDAPAPVSAGTHGFVALFEPSGDLRWAVGLFAQISARVRNAAAVLGRGLVVVGRLDSETDFGGQMNVTPDSPAYFVARFEDDGSITFVKTGSGSSTADYVDAFPDGSFVVAGERPDPEDVVFGKGEANETLVPDGNTTDYLARFHPDGNLDWVTASQAPEMFDLSTAGVAARDDGISILALRGDFDTIATFPGTPPVPVDAADGGDGIVLVGFDPLGGALWGRTLQVTSEPQSNPLAASPEGFFLTGTLDFDEAVFGAGEANETLLQPLAGSPTMFLAHYNADGTLRWATQAVDADEYHHGLAVAARPGGVVLAGTNFGSMTLQTMFGEVEHVSTGDYDFFVFPMPDPPEDPGD